MHRHDLLDFVQIGEGARYAQDPVIAPGREGERLGRLPQQLFAGAIDPGDFIQQGRRALGIEPDAVGLQPLEPPALPGASASHAPQPAASLPSPAGGKERSAGVTGGTVMRMSMRSRSGPEIRA